MNKKIKNLELSTILTFAAQVEYQTGQIVSKTLAQNNSVNLTIFAFDKDEEISTHASDGDALITILDGCGEITIGNNKYILHSGESILMPAKIPHAVFAKERLKMFLTVIF